MALVGALGCSMIDAAPTAAPLPAAEHPRLSIYGRMVTQDGRPAYGATVVAISMMPFDHHMTMCDADGYYWISSVPPGTTVIDVTYARKRIETSVKVDDRAPIRYDAVVANPLLQLDAQGNGPLTIDGHLVDSRSRPAVAATVVLVSPDMEGEEVVLSDEHGDYRLGGLSRGRYNLTVYYNNATTQLSVDAGTRLNVRQDAVLPDPPTLVPAGSARK